MGKALYREYRPKKLSEVVGQEHITTTLENALKQGRISHAYLLTGPRGVGKTSVARILAHDINGLRYDDETHLDIIEIDAASNRRIDEIRDLRDRVNIAPSAAKYKVYIIDEVHMLTKEAFNALLKTLEEPPAHVVFILATTEAHKLPETIISRTQRFSFRPVPVQLAANHLKQLAKKEKINIDDDALTLLAKRGEGSLRDSIGLLDQAGNASGKITLQTVEQMLGLAPDRQITELQASVTRGDNNAIANGLTVLYGQGFEAAMIALQLGENLRHELLSDTSTLPPAATLALLKRLLDVPAARQPKQLLELLLLEAALPPLTDTPTTVVNEPSATPKQPSATTPAAAAAPKPDPPAEKSAAIKTAVPATTSTDASKLWQQVLEAIKKQHNTLYGIARMAKPTLDGDRFTLGFKFVFHQKRLNEAKNRKLLSDMLEQFSGRALEIICVVDDSITAVKDQPDVSTISNIFGGAELLQ